MVHRTRARVVERALSSLCWKLGETRIEFWHRQDEGFAGRKPISNEFGSAGGPSQPN